MTRLLNYKMADLHETQLNHILALLALMRRRLRAGRTRQDRKGCIHFPMASPYMVINYHQLELKVTSIHSHCHCNLRIWDMEENSHDRTQARCLPSPLPTYHPQHLMVRECHNWRGDKEDGNGATQTTLSLQEEGKWLATSSACRKTRTYSNVLGARRRQKKDGEAEEAMAKHFQRRHGRDGRQLAWSPKNRQWPWKMETSHRPMLQEEQVNLSLSR